MSAARDGQGRTLSPVPKSAPCHPRHIRTNDKAGIPPISSLLMSFSLPHGKSSSSHKVLKRVQTARTESVIPKHECRDTLRQNARGKRRPAARDNQEDTGYYVSACRKRGT